MRRDLTLIVLVLATGCNLFESTEAPDPATPDAGLDATVPDAGGDVGPLADQGPTDASMMPDASDAAMEDMPTADDLSSDADLSVDDMPIETCGNGVIDDTEDCEPGIGATTCVDLGHEGGLLSCDPSTCTWDESTCHSCDFYFAPESGDDANTGTTAAEAWQSLDRFESMLDDATGANAGEVICIRRGEEWYLERGAAVSRSGSLGAPIIVGDYGDPAAALPLMTTSTPLAAAGWTSLGGGIYSHPLADINQVLSHVWHGDTERATDATDATLTDGNKFWDGATLYIKLGGGLNQTVWVASDDETLDIRGGARHLEFRNIRFSHGEHAIEFHADASDLGDIRVVGCAFDHFDDAIRGYSNGSDVVNITVERSSFSVCGNGLLNTAMPGRLSQGFRLINNTAQNALRDGGSIFELHNPHDCEVSGNDFRSPSGQTNGAIILAAVDAGSTVERVVVANNYIEGHTHGVFIHFENDGDPRTVETTITNNITVGQEQDGVRVETCDVNGTSLIAHNTMASAGDDSLQVAQDCGWKVFNNLSASPAEDHIDELPHPTGAPMTANDIDYNVFASAIAEFERGDTPLTFFQWQALNYDLNSIVVGSAGFVGPIPNDPADYMLVGGFEAIDFGVDVGVSRDFGGRPRPAGAAVDAGAWERQASDQ